MNHINILKRALDITINYRALWIFGMLLALTSGSGNGNGGNNPSPNTDPNLNWQNPFSEFPQLSSELANMWIGIAISVAILILIFILIGSIARYVSETALIRMVDEHENSGEQLTIRQGFRLGWSRAAWKIFLMDLLVGVSFVTIFILLLALAALPLLVWLTENTPLQVVGTIISAGSILLLVFAAIVAALAVTLIMIFARRACVLEDLGVRDSLRRGYEMVRQRLGDMVMMGVMMFGIGLLWIIITIPIILAIVVVAALVGGVPALLAGSIAGFFTQGNTPWIVAAIVGAPIFLVAVIIPATLIGGWQKVFSSSAWTLTYRETLALEKINVIDELPPSDSVAEA
ncbi:MAG TPA: hypothetical protein VNA23_01780 [Anaerolineales bacterium]|nr:hypothetical protein [Anaerolineales bacterium]